MPSFSLLYTRAHVLHSSEGLLVFLLSLLSFDASFLYPSKKSVSFSSGTNDEEAPEAPPPVSSLAVATPPCLTSPPPL